MQDEGKRDAEGDRDGVADDVLLFHAEGTAVGKLQRRPDDRN